MNRSKSAGKAQFVFAGVLFFTAMACASPPPVESAPQPQSKSKSKQLAVAAAAEVDSGELPDQPAKNVPHPSVIMMTGRVSDPIGDLAALRKFVPAPSGITKDILENPRGVVRIVFGALGGQIKLDRPVDIAIFSPDSRLPPAFSFHLHDFPRTRKQLTSDFSFTKGNDGGLEVAPKPGAAHGGVMAKANLACSVYASAVPDAYQLVCSESTDSRAMAGRYLAQVASAVPFRPGLHIDLHESFFQIVVNRERDRLEREAASNSAYDKGQRLGGRLVQHAFEDMKSMGVDFASDSGGVHAALEIGFKSARSPLSVGILGGGTVGSATPAEFFRIPADADMGFYFPGASRTTMRPAAEEFWTELASADFSGGATDLWRQFIPKLSKVLLTGGPSIVAHGPSIGGPAPVGLDNGAEVFRLARAAVADWTLIGVFEPFDTWTAATRNLLQKPTIFIKRTPAELARPNEDRKVKTVESTEEVPLTAADGLPSGSMHIVMTHVPNSLYRSGSTPPLDGPYTRHIYMSGTKSMTWIVFSDNATLAQSKLAEVIKASGPGLTQRKDLAALRNMPPGGIGFASVSAMAAAMAERDTVEGLIDERKTTRFLTSESGGTEPILFSLITRSNGGENALRIQAHGSEAMMQTFVEWVRLRSKR